MGVLPLGVYWLAFSAFGASQIPWKIALGLEIFCPVFVYVQYLMNRRSRRLYWEGAAAFVSLLPFWMAVGSHWFFYLGFAPLPATVRSIALSFGIVMTIVTIWMTWRNYERATARLNLIHRMNAVGPNLLVYPDGLEAGVSMFERSWSWLPVPPASLVSAIGSVVVACALLSGRVFDQANGPHILFIMLSVIGFPISCLFIGHFLVRVAYFHIYLPIKIERETGKKVILGP